MHKPPEYACNTQQNPRPNVPSSQSSKINAKLDVQFEACQKRNRGKPKPHNAPKEHKKHADESGQSQVGKHPGQRFR